MVCPDVRASNRPAGKRRIEEWDNLRHVVTLGAKVVECLEQVRALLVPTARITLHVDHVDVGRHHLLDLSLPEGRLTGPSRTPFHRPPGAVDCPPVLVNHGKTVVLT